MDPTKFRPSSAYNGPFYTTNQGAPVWNNEQSLTVGPRGPILLEDYHLVEKLANFDRERIPERVVHARGAAAKGYFETTHDITHLTCADLFRAPGVQTPVVTRFSTVVHSKGSPETLRDPRGFAVKFYTREGNWDLVGNNMPVFFIRDGIKFPDLVHAFKPNPVTNQQEAWRIMDFLSHVPESCHMLTFLLHDVGIPLNYRHMPGFGVHTYKLINKTGKETLVKFHWLPKAGTKNLLDDEAERVGGECASHATKDLYEHLSSGGTAEWTLAIQTMDPADQDKFSFDPLDVTKSWPEDTFPLQQVGRMVLTTPPSNFFLESEQVAFCPGVVVPGIYYSDDKLLQTRIFSYSDTQRHRLGPNYLQLPINAPRNVYRNSNFDGSGNTMSRTEDVNYFPSRFDKARAAKKPPTVSDVVSGRRVKEVIPKENNFEQAGVRYRSWSPAEQERFIGRVADMLNDKRLSVEVRRIWLGYWTACDASLGSRLSKKVCLKPNM